MVYFSVVFAITYIFKRLIYPASLEIRLSWDFYLQIIYFSLKVSIDHRKNQSRKLTLCTKVYLENIKQIKKQNECITWKNVSWTFLASEEDHVMCLGVKQWRETS